MQFLSGIQQQSALIGLVIKEMQGRQLQVNFRSMSLTIASKYTANDCVRSWIHAFAAIYRHSLQHQSTGLLLIKG
jgi:hypothetical protein